MRKWMLSYVAIMIVLLGCNFTNGIVGEDDTDPLPAQIQPAESQAEPPALVRADVKTVDDPWDLWTGGTLLRGADLHPCTIASEGVCQETITRQDVYDLAALGANLINDSYPGVFSVDSPYEIDTTAVAYLDDLIVWAEEVGIFVVIHFRSGPGRNESAIHQLRDADMSIWDNQTAQDHWVDMWRFAAERYGDSPAVAGFNLMVEPLANLTVDPRGELDPQAVQAQLEGTLADWNVLARKMTEGIREVDPTTPIIVNSLNWANSAWFDALEPTGDDRTVYSFHAYNPDVYTGQEEGEEDIRYPDEVEDSGETIIFDRTWLEDDFAPVIAFSQTHDVPIYVGEFGAMRWVPDAADFIHDQTGLFEEYGWNYAYYVWRGDEVGFDGFNMEHGIDPANHTPGEDNDLIQMNAQRWSQNEYFPMGSASDNQPTTPLADVEKWLYLIDVNLEDETVDQIVSSDYEMVVIDNIPSEENNTDYPMGSVIKRLHEADHPKLVIAYIDIGQAEDFRTYWQPGWGVGDPEWIAGGDPDGWEGNYPVAYWYDEYRYLWLDDGGLMEGILDADFDGIYLDWVEAYSDENVLDLASADGVDPVQEMIWWVGDLAEYGRERNPEFIVIGQNAAELAAYDDYVAIIDAIAQEQVWFDGGSDNVPPGDCPLPRTEADIDTDEYRDSLSRECRQQYDEFPESTLHVSSEGYIEDLQAAQEEGVTIFTVDYALDPDNVSWVYENSRALGFIPFVSGRNLDSYIPPYPLP